MTEFEEKVEFQEKAFELIRDTLTQSFSEVYILEVLKRCRSIVLEGYKDELVQYLESIEGVYVAQTENQNGNQRN